MADSKISLIILIILLAVLVSPIVSQISETNDKNNSKLITQDENSTEIVFDPVSSEIESIYSENNTAFYSIQDTSTSEKRSFNLTKNEEIELNFSRGTITVTLISLTNSTSTTLYKWPISYTWPTNLKTNSGKIFNAFSLLIIAVFIFLIIRLYDKA